MLGCVPTGDAAARVPAHGGQGQEAHPHPHQHRVHQDERLPVWCPLSPEDSKRICHNRSQCVKKVAYLSPIKFDLFLMI